MLLRLVGKMLFKATVPLIAVAGVLTYGVYMRGGDPSALWKGAVDGTLAQAYNLVSGLKNDATRAAGALSSPGAVLTGAGSASEGALTTVFTWQDAQGVTHYSSTQPEHAQSRTVTVDPDVNVLVPVRAKPVARESGAGNNALSAQGQLPGSASNVSEVLQTTRSGAANRQGAPNANADLEEVTEELGGTLPGVAGQVLSTTSGEAGTLDPAQLIRMLQ